MPASLDEKAKRIIKFVIFQLTGLECDLHFVMILLLSLIQAHRVAPPSDSEIDGWTFCRKQVSFTSNWFKRPTTDTCFAKKLTLVAIGGSRG